MEDGMKDLRARWVFTVGILYLLPSWKEVQNLGIMCQSLMVLSSTYVCCYTRLCMLDVVYSTSSLTVHEINILHSNPENSQQVDKETVTLFIIYSIFYYFLTHQRLSCSFSSHGFHFAIQMQSCDLPC